jgi:hypothetical protein
MQGDTGQLMQLDACLRSHPGVILGWAALWAAVATGCSRCERPDGASRADSGPAQPGVAASGSAEADPEGQALPRSASAATDDTDYSHIELPEPPTPPDLRSSAVGPKQDRSIFDDYGLPWHPTAVHLCGKRLLHPGGGQSVWDAFWSKVSPQKLVTDYQRRLSKRGFTAEDPGGIWKLPEGAPTPRRTLHILRVSSPGEHQSCDETPDATAKSVLILTRNR